MKKLIAIVCTLIMLIGLMPQLAIPTQAAVQLSTAQPYQVGYARVDINPYVIDGDPTSGLMALPLGGAGGSTWDRLSTYGLIDDNGDGVVDQNDGIKATCIAVTDENGRTILMVTLDTLGIWTYDPICNAVIDRVNIAIENGEITGTEPIIKDQIYVAGTHTHESIASFSYRAAGKTGTNADGVDLGVVNENLGIWLERTYEDIADAAILALKDRAAAQLSKDYLSAGQATAPVFQDRTMNGTRHYRTEVDGEEFVAGDNSNSISKYHYADPSDYTGTRGADPKAVTVADDSIYLLTFDFADETKLPIIVTTWRGHPSLAMSSTYENSNRYCVSSDYVGAYRHALEYGCDVSFDSTNGYITGWTLGTTQKYRVAFFSDTGGNVNTRSFEVTTYNGSDGAVTQREYSWIDGSATTAAVKGRSCSYGVVLATLAQECLGDGLNETAVRNGTIRVATATYCGSNKTTGVTELAYKAALACKAAAENGTILYPYRYTDPETGEKFPIASAFHTDKLISMWNTKLNTANTGTNKLTLGAYMLGTDVAFLAIPCEPFDYYYKDETLTGDAKYAPENNLWNDLIDDSTYGKPIVLGYCNGYQSYFPNDEAYVYNEGSENWAMGSYEAQIARFERGCGEDVVRLFDSMLTSLSSGSEDLTYTASCAHCGENQIWQPYGGQTTLTTGHYYLMTNTHTTQIKVSGGQTVCIDLKGHTLAGETRALYASDTTKDILNIMDSSEAQTGKVQGCGVVAGAGIGFWGATLLVAADDVLNLYSGTITDYERTSYSVQNAGVLGIYGTFNMYGGEVVGGTASSFTGSYYSGGVKTATRTGNGGTMYLSGTLNMYGGKIYGGDLSTVTGTAVTTDDSYTYRQEEAPRTSGNGPCVWVTAAGTVNLSGEASIEHIHFADGDGLSIIGNYTGSAEIKYNGLTELTEGTRVGTAGTAADTTFADITFTDAPGMTAAVKGGDLIIDPLPYAYSTCEYCGECRWQPMTDADFDAFGSYNMAPGHYRLTEDVTTTQKSLNKNADHPGTFCVDLAGHTFSGSIRGFLVYEGATLNIMDSVGGGVVEGCGSAAVAGGSLYVTKNSVINFYGGTVRSNPVNSETRSAGGAVTVIGGTFNLHGGTVEGSAVTGNGGAIQVKSDYDVPGTFTATGGQVVAGTAAKNGNCVYVDQGGYVVLSGDAKMDEIFFYESSADLLTVSGSYSGTVALKYPETVELTDLTDIGNSMDGDVSHASITFTDVPDKTAAVKGSDLVVSDSSYSYGYCEDCGLCQWIPMTDADFDAFGNYGMVPGHYILTENVVTAQKSLNKGGTNPGTYCVDLNGHTFTGETRAFYLYDGTVMNLFDSVGCGVAEGYGSAATWGSVIYVEIGAEFHMYGGTVRHNSAKTETVTNGGAITARGGNVCIYGGTVEGSKVSGYGGTMYIASNSGTYGSLTVAGGKITAGTAANIGECIYVNGGCPVTLSGDAEVAEIRFSGSSAKSLTVDGDFAGSVKLAYPSAISLTDGSTLGTVSPVGDLSKATVTLAGESCKAAKAEDGALVVVARHNYDAVITAPTCTEVGYTTYTCHCGDSYVVDEVAALGHRYETVTVDATCTTDGSITQTCATCGDTKVEILPATGHSYETVTVDATCTADGSATNTCRTCGDTQVEIISATGHSYEPVVTVPTCTETGYTTYTCHCGDQFVADMEDALGHSFDVSVVDPDCVIPGYTAHRCSRCGYSYYDSVVPALGHHDQRTVIAPTCTETGYTAHYCNRCDYSYYANIVPALGHDYEATVTEPTYTSSGYTTYTCIQCGDSYKDEITEPIGHNYEITVVDATCTTVGYTLYTCTCGESYTENELPILGHSYENGICILCGQADPNDIVKPTLTLKVPTLEFKDMICIIAFYTAENIEDVVEMGMITYSEKVAEYGVETADHVIPGYSYDAASGRYYSSSQGIHAKYLGDTVYMACYAKLKDGSYVYTKLKSYSPVQYATNQLANSTDTELKQLVAAMLNYGAAAQLYFGHNTDALANASLTDEQKALPESYRADMISAVPSTPAAKQGTFANNKGFAKKYPAISFEGAFCINYFFTPNYTPVDGITLYYWNEADYTAAEVLTAENVTGTIKMTGSGTEQYRGDVVGISAKDLSKAVYVAAVYSDGTTTWTSGVLGYSIGVYCGSLATQGGTMGDLAMATAVYGYHAKQYFN